MGSYSCVQPVRWHLTLLDCTHCTITSYLTSYLTRSRWSKLCMSGLPTLRFHQGSWSTGKPWSSRSKWSAEDWLSQRPSSRSLRISQSLMLLTTMDFDRGSDLQAWHLIWQETREISCSVHQIARVSKHFRAIRASHWAHDVVATSNQRQNDVDSMSQKRRLPSGWVLEALSQHSFLF